MRSLLILVGIWLAAATAGAHDFSRYTELSADVKTALRANRQARFGASGHVPGNVAVFGNSITQPAEFWTPFAESGSVAGIVPGTNRASYLIDKQDPVFCAVSGYRIGDGVWCLSAAMDTLRPEVVVCMYGTNDAWSADTISFQSRYMMYLDTLLGRGVVPVVSTIPPRRGSFYDTLQFDAMTARCNGIIRRVAALVDFWQAFMDYTNGRPFTAAWYTDQYVHPSPCSLNGLTDLERPGCGLGIRNAVSWQAVNKVYRIIIENGVPDAVGDVRASTHGLPGITIGRDGRGVVVNADDRADMIGVELYTIAGRMSAVGSKTGPQTWQSGPLATGIYLVRVRTGNSVWTAKVLCP